jgi:hypothetical protein
MPGLRVGGFQVDHQQSVLPPSRWTPKRVGADRVIPRIEAHLEPWTILGYLAGHHRVGRMRVAYAPKSLARWWESCRGRDTDEIVEQPAEFHDRGTRYLVVGNAGAIQPSLRKSAATTAPYIKALRGPEKTERESISLTEEQDPQCQ